MTFFHILTVCLLLPDLLAFSESKKRKAVMHRIVIFSDFGFFSSCLVCQLIISVIFQFAVCVAFFGTEYLFWLQNTDVRWQGKVSLTVSLFYLSDCHIFYFSN